MDKEQIIALADRLDIVRKGMEAGLDDWPTASQIWEYQQASKALRSLVVESDAAIESYKAGLLKEVGEPVGYLHQWIEYHPYGDTVAGEPCSAINNEGKPFDESDTVTLLFTSDQVAAAIIKATKQLEEEVDSLEADKAYFEIGCDELRTQLAAAQEEIQKLRQDLLTSYGESEELSGQLAKAEQLWQVAQGRCDGLEEKLAKAEQRVAEACKSMCLRLVRKEKNHAAGYGIGYLNYSAQDVADFIDNGEWRKFVKEV